MDLQTSLSQTQDAERQTRTTGLHLLIDKAPKARSSTKKAAGKQQVHKAPAKATKKAVTQHKKSNHCKEKIKPKLHI